jgi:hypothetical protein
MSCCEITQGQDNESTNCVTCYLELSYEFVMITTRIWMWIYEYVNMIYCKPMSMKIKYYGQVYWEHVLWECWFTLSYMDCVLLMNEMQL